MSAAEVPEGLDRETGELPERTANLSPVVLLNRDEAEALTAEIKDAVSALWMQLRRAHQGQAWRALGYKSWRGYIDAEFDFGQAYAYRLLTHGNAVYELAEAAGLDPEVSPIGDTLTEGKTRGLDVPAVADEIAERVAGLSDDASDEDRLNVVKQTTTETRTTETTFSGSEDADPGEAANQSGAHAAPGDPTAPPVVGSPPLAPAPDLEPGASVGDVITHWPTRGQWGKTKAFQRSERTQAFAGVMDHRLPRDNQEAAQVAAWCPAEYRAGAAIAAQNAAAWWSEVANGLRNPNPIGVVK